MIGPVYQKLINRKANGTTVLGISGKELHKTKIQFPSLPEQQKIASFLSAVDEKIQQLTKKKELLSDYKKGVMQKLFSGQLRFKDENGKAYPDWEEIKVQKLIDKKAIIGLLDGNHGELYPKSEEFTEHGVPYVAANSLVNGLVNFSECKRLPIERAAKFKKGIAINGDVLFAHNATVGPTAILKTEFDYVILSTTVTYYRCNNKILSNRYLLQYFNSDNFIRQYTRVMSQSTRNQVPITMQKKFKVLFPCIEEQQKIAKYLSSIDTKIESVNNQITQTQNFKKGLLQGMFV
jgi:type I restriction enzyme S subunit